MGRRQRRVRLSWLKKAACEDALEEQFTPHFVASYFLELWSLSLLVYYLIIDGAPA